MKVPIVEKRKVLFCDKASLKSHLFFRLYLYIIITKTNDADDRWTRALLYTVALMHRDTQRHQRASLCAVHGEGSRAKFHHEVSREAGCRAFSHKSFALSVKIMSTSKKITLLRCFRRVAGAGAPCSDCLQLYRTALQLLRFVRDLLYAVYALSPSPSYVGQG